MKKLIIILLTLLLIWLTQCEHSEPVTISMHVNDLRGIIVISNERSPVILIGQCGGVLSNQLVQRYQK